MKKHIISLFVLFGTLLTLVGCSSLKPQDIVHNTVETSYHFWHNERQHERGIKFNIIIKGERLNNIEVENIVVHGTTIPVETKLVEPLDRDAVSTLYISAIYKEKKGKKEKSFKKLPNSLFGKDPYKNGIMNYSIKGKSDKVEINEFIFKTKG